MIETIVFGGTFDPPHKGHIHIVESALVQFQPKRLIVIPSYVPPHKTNKERTAFHHRFNMCEIVFSSMRSVDVSDIESRLDQPSYTLKTLQHLVSEGFSNLGFLLGGDSLSQFTSWFHFEKILSLTELIVYPRDNNVRIIPVDLESYRARINYLSGELLEQSSSGLRNDKSWEYVNDDVHSYIRKNNLYSP